MNKVIITTDSTADIPADIAEKYNIRVAPLHVLYDDEDFTDGVDITPEYILRRYDEREQLPSSIILSPSTYIWHSSEAVSCTGLNPYLAKNLI